MKALLVGSLADGRSNVCFQELCKELGRVVAKQGWTLIVSGNSETDPDHWALSGANETGCRVVLYPPEGAAQGWSSVAPEKSHPGPMVLLNEVTGQYPKLDTTLLPPPPGNWNVGYAQAVAYAHVVILIGGKDGTRLVGQLATALLKPVIAIPCFGGSAEDEWTRQRTRYDSLRERGKVSDDVINDLRSQTPARLAAAVATMCEILVRESGGKSFSNRRVIVLLFLTILLIGAWTAVFIWPTAVQATVQKSFTPVAPVAIAKLACLLWISTSAGVIFRAVWRHLKKPTELFSFDSVGIELLVGFLTAFAYLIACFAGAGIYKQNPFDLTAEDVTRMGVLLSAGGFAIGVFLEESAEYVSEKVLKKFRS